MDENHQHLVTLGVSHPSLEAIKAKTQTPFGLSTKLTGAGGGGCAVTLIPDGERSNLSCISYTRLTRSLEDFEDERLQDLISLLIRESFQPYLTSVGGSGLGILSPYAEHRNHGSQIHRPPGDFGQVTPPGTPTPSKQHQPEIVDRYEKGVNDLDSLRASFVSSTVAELPEWASDLGRWLYV